YRERPGAVEARPAAPGRSIDEIVPYDQRKWFDMYEVIGHVVDAGSFFEIKRLFAQEIITGFARLGGRAVGIVANQPKVKGGVLMVDSSDKAARFIWLCNAFNIPLVYLADVAGFMVGSRVEREGIIRHGAKMVFATSQATVPKISVIVRKCYGAGLYAMCGPAFEPDATLSLPQGQIAIMGPGPAETSSARRATPRIPTPPSPSRANWWTSTQRWPSVSMRGVCANRLKSPRPRPSRSTRRATPGPRSAAATAISGSTRPKS